MTRACVGFEFRVDDFIGVGVVTVGLRRGIRLNFGLWECLASTARQKDNDGNDTKDISNNEFCQFIMKKPAKCVLWG